MSRTVTRRPRAGEDLIDIWSYIAEVNESAADRFLDKIEATLKHLAEHPQTGRPRPEVRTDLRSFPLGRYIIFYLPIPDGIELIRVLSSYLDFGQDDLE